MKRWVKRSFEGLKYPSCPPASVMENHIKNNLLNWLPCGVWLVGGRLAIGLDCCGVIQINVSIHGIRWQQQMTAIRTWWWWSAGVGHNLQTARLLIVSDVLCCDRVCQQLAIFVIVWTRWHSWTTADKWCPCYSPQTWLMA